MQITEFKKIGNSNRYKMFVDSQFFAVLLDETIVLNNLKTNVDYDLDYLNKIVFEGQKKVAFDSAIAVVSKFSKTEKEMQNYLKDKGFLQSSVDFAVQKLKEYNYINDDNFAKNYISTKQNSKGKKAIFFELKMKGIEENIIKKHLQNIEGQEQTLLVLATKFAKNKQNDTKLKEKLFRHLVSKGFDFEEINNTIKKVLKNESWD
ncbi:MAG: regulatory protein RecX [Clostridia bacterium]|nr:regulatory protein RecX [Clostridia bacterium]